MDDCIFCLIASGQIPAAKIWEDDNFLAFLDNRPNTKGMTLVISKEHHDSYVFKMDQEKYQQFFLAAKKVANLLERALTVPRVIMVMEGLGVNHAHLKLYPVYGLRHDSEAIESQEKVFFKEFPGYATTISGPLVKLEKLEELASEIRKHN
jgi:histidine triad (HIT) family protein